jgi:hypothetical protein
MVRFNGGMVKLGRVKWCEGQMKDGSNNCRVKWWESQMKKRPWLGTHSGGPNVRCNMAKRWKGV